MLKKETIIKIYSEAARTYDLTNRILTLGLDSYWRRKAAREAAEAGGDLWLDVCSGTGDMAILLNKFAGTDTKIIATDFSREMTGIAQEKTKDHKIEFHISDSANLPFGDNSFDMVIISFATRNLNTNREKLIQYFQEFSRILKPGGRFINLETSQPKSKLVKWFFYSYVNLIIAPVGYFISGSKKAYRYLSYTIRHFYRSEELTDILYQAGFSKVFSTRLTFGICEIHTSIK